MNVPLTSSGSLPPGTTPSSSVVAEHELPEARRRATVAQAQPVPLRPLAAP